MTGDTKLATDLLDAIAANYDSWENDPVIFKTFDDSGVFPMGGDGKGMFISTDNREAGAYVALPPDVAQIDMNGDFISVHALADIETDLALPYPCTVVNLKNGKIEPTCDGFLPLAMSTGETCQFALKPDYMGAALQRYVDDGEIPGVVSVLEKVGLKAITQLWDAR